jgi:hypothetical protein
MRCSELKMQPNEVRKQHRRRKVRSTQIKSILRRRHGEQGIAPASGARHTAITRSVEASALHGTVGGKLNARDLWENWGRARPFTLGRRYFNLGETHDVALAGAKFGSIDQIPEDFDEWEQVARTDEANYVRGWVARDGRRMFLWDDVDDLIRKPSHFEFFTHGLIMLQEMKYASLRTELWDRGGERYLGLLGTLALLSPGRLSRG